MGLTDQDVSDTYYTTLLKYVGCTAYAQEEASLFGGEDNAARAAGAAVDFADQREALGFLLFRFARELPPMRRMHILAGVLARGPGLNAELKTAHCEVAATIARRLGLSSAVQQALYQIFERWDGKGPPHGLAGEQVALPARVAQVASQAMVFDRVGGPDGAQEMIQRWSGAALDPSIAQAFVRHGRAWLEEIATIDVWEAVLEAEPKPPLSIPAYRLDEVAHAFADFVDLKSPFTRGHSPAVAQLAEGAARHLGLPGDDVTAVRQAGLLHDLGRADVPNGIWDKPGPLTMSEWERVRLHPYQTDRILARSPLLAPLAPMAGMHHERLDGSGYHHQVRATAIPLGARLLAAADSYQAMSQVRPHRSRLSPSEAAEQLYRDVKEERLDARAVEAVLASAGHATRPSRRAWPANLSDREVEVLRLLARGSSTREVAASLTISPKTADHHIQHIYNKIGVSTRAAATMFAMEHDLLSD
jgi:putative nucleotidyltransferase with HDIG domain